ncbi:hypothetical protein D3C72_1660640 [compost metagenome]
MPIDLLAVDLLDIVGEEISDVLVGGPVGGHAQVIPVLGLELVFQVLAGEPVGAEPVHVGELLVGQLVQLAVGRRGELGADEVLQVQLGVGPFLARAGHVVGQRQDGAVAVVGADQVGIGDPAVVNGFSGLHRRLQLFDDVAFLDQVVVDFDAGDFREGLGQHLGLVFVRGDGLGHYADFIDAFGLQLGRGVDEPFHLGHLLVFGQRRRLELRIDPLLRFRLAGPSP